MSCVIFHCESIVFLVLVTQADPENESLLSQRVRICGDVLIYFLGLIQYEIKELATLDSRLLTFSLANELRLEDE